MRPGLPESKWGGTVGRMTSSFYICENQGPERVSGRTNITQLVRTSLRPEPKS